MEVKYSSLDHSTADFDRKGQDYVCGKCESKVLSKNETLFKTWK